MNKSKTNDYKKAALLLSDIMIQKTKYSEYLFILDKNLNVLDVCAFNKEKPFFEVKGENNIEQVIEKLPFTGLSKRNFLSHEYYLLNFNSLSDDNEIKKKYLGKTVVSISDYDVFYNFS